VKSAPVVETVDDIDGMWSDDDNKKKKKGKNGKQAPAEEAAKPESNSFFTLVSLCLISN